VVGKRGARGGCESRRKEKRKAKQGEKGKMRRENYRKRKKAVDRKRT